MQFIYKPSGIVSVLLPVFIPLIYLVQIPVISFFHGFVVFYSPYSILFYISVIICWVTVMTLLWSHWHDDKNNWEEPRKYLAQPAQDTYFTTMSVISIGVLVFVLLLFWR